jgi:mono/diheme cytochrome c family protein
MRLRAALIIVMLLVVATAIALYAASERFRIDVPKYRRPGQIVELDQSWTEKQRADFRHWPQGTRLLPYKWFMALEQPTLSLTAGAPFADGKYLARFGFVASKPEPRFNPDGLPIGFAKEDKFYDPETRKTYPVVGFTCAACHTGEMHWTKYTVHADGAPAMVDLAEFQKALGFAVAFTDKLPFRYRRFEKRVLGPNATANDRKELKQAFRKFVDTAQEQKSGADEREIYAHAAGFARTDALARIGNQVFGVDMRNSKNLERADAPVRFPQIWDASWFNWVQYNSSIADPLVRNIGEALGVRAMAVLSGASAGEFENSVNVPGLKVLEDLLSGDAPFQGLSSPRWPAIFPPLDPHEVDRGAQLYKQHCQSCHLPPIKELQADLALKNPVYWQTNNQGKRFLKVKDLKVEYIGTDPNEASAFLNRKADTGDLKQGEVGAGEGLELVTRGIANRFFQQAGFSQARRIAWSGYRDPEAKAVRSAFIYKARPLNGIWAAAPYLHNGSVPTLYQLLSPVSERPSTFWLGSKQYDPVNVGYETQKLKGGYFYDVTLSGNHNQGHEFRDGPRGKGVIGPLLPPQDRRALIAYMKSL